MKWSASKYGSSSVTVLGGAMKLVIMYPIKSKKEKADKLPYVIYVGGKREGRAKDFPSGQKLAEKIFKEAMKKQLKEMK